MDWYRQEAEHAISNGLRQNAGTSTWTCPLCGMFSINPGNLAAHISSNKHRGAVYWDTERREVERQQRDNELPWWMGVDNNMEKHCKICNRKANDTHISSDRHLRYVAWAEFERRQTVIMDVQAHRSTQPAITDVQASGSDDHWQPPPLPAPRSHAGQSMDVDLVHSCTGVASGLQPNGIWVNGNLQPAPPMTPPPRASPKARAARANIIELQACGPAVPETWCPPPPSHPPPPLRSEAPPATASCSTMQNHRQPPPPTDPPPQEREWQGKRQIFSSHGTWEPAPPTNPQPQEGDERDWFTERQIWMNGGWQPAPPTIAQPGYVLGPPAPVSLDLKHPPSTMSP